MDTFYFVDLGLLDHYSWIVGFIGNMLAFASEEISSWMYIVVSYNWILDRLDYGYYWNRGGCLRLW